MFHLCLQFLLQYKFYFRYYKSNYRTTPRATIQKANPSLDLTMQFSCVLDILKLKLQNYSLKLKALAAALLILSIIDSPIPVTSGKNTEIALSPRLSAFLKDEYN